MSLKSVIARLGTPLPTDLPSAELRGLDADIRQRSLISARTNNRYYLQRLSRNLQKLVSGEIDIATARLRLKEELQRIGYQPEAGQEGTIQDLSSDQRLNLILQTNQQLAENFGRWRRDQDEGLLNEFPAYEYLRVSPRFEKRPWLERFGIAGDAAGEATGWLIQGERMYALKNHRIWDFLGSSAMWDDALDVHHPPFAFNSGMGWIDVERSEALELGILQRGERVLPDQRAFLEEEIA